MAVPAVAGAISGPPSGLSPRLVELAKPSLRSAPAAVQARKLGLAPHGAGSLLRRGNRVLVYVRFDRGALVGTEALREAGAEVVDASGRYQTDTVAARPDELHAVAAAPGVAAVTPALTPVAAATCPSGAVVSEGVKQLNAGEGEGEARKEFGVDGSGVAVGILSDSFDQAIGAATTASKDVSTGDLPGLTNPCGHLTPVAVLEKETVLAGEEPPEDEGRAMEQIIHDIAPKANLSFASAFNGEQSFAKNIKSLATAGAKVIADDVFYFEEPFFQDGPVATAVNEVVAGGVSYFSAAGNDNLIDAEGHEIASWETPAFRDGGSCPEEVEALPAANGGHCLDFNPGAERDETFGIKVEPGGVLSIDLQWDESWNAVGTDLDAYLLGANGKVIAASMEDNVKGSQKPLEVVQWANESASTRTVQLVVNRFSGGSPRVKFGLLENGFGVAATEYPRSTGPDVVGPTVFGHSGTAGAISVGAIPFDDSAEPEEYSSRGPVRHDFEAADEASAGAPLGSPEILSKPDLAATDCGVTTFFASFAGGVWRFCGTSAAAPHAAGVAALLLDEKPLASPAEVRAALQASAEPVGSFDACAVGAGLVEAVGAIEALLSPSPFTPPSCSVPTPEGSVEEARAPGDWGAESPASGGTGTATGTVTAPPSAVEPEARRLPRTFIRLRPRKLILTHSRTVRVVFRFGSDESGVTFACRIDGSLYRSCGERLVRRFGLGPHSLRVIARDVSGEADPSPASYRFRVERVG